MSKVPWYPLGSRSKNARNLSSSTSGSTNYAETLLNSSSFSDSMNRTMIFPMQQPVQYGTKRRHETEQGKQAGRKQKTAFDPSRPIRSYYVQHKHRTDFTPEELAEKRRIAIEEEAVKKKERDRIAQIKIEEKWVELGKIICSLNPRDLRLNETPDFDDMCTLDETLANVSNFTKNLNSLVGNEAKGTVLAHSIGFAGALCNVPTKSFVHVERRVNSSKQLREEMEQREKEAKAREQLIKQSDESRRRFSEFKEIEERNGYVNLHYGRGGRPPAKVTLAASDRIRLAVAEEAEKKIKRDEEARIKKENHWIKLGAAICNLRMDDFILPPEDSKSDSDSEEQDIAERGEEIVIAVATFVQSLKSLVGEKNSNESVLADQNSLTATLCGVTRAAITTRYSFKNKRKRRVNS